MRSLDKAMSIFKNHSLDVLSRNNYLFFHFSELVVLYTSTPSVLDTEF